MTLRRSMVLALVVTMYAARGFADPASPAQVRAQQLIDKGLDYLKSQQKPDGGWQRENDPPGVTAIVLRAFARERRAADEPFVKKGLDKLLSYQKPNGGIYQDMLANYNTAI